MLISGDFINVLCSPETDFVVVHTDFVKYCQKYWVCIHVSLVGMTIPATVLTVTSDHEVQHPRTKRTTCHRSTWTTNTLQLTLPTDFYPLDTEESNRVSNGPSIDSLEILWISFVFCCLLRQTLLDPPHSAFLPSSQSSHPSSSQLNPSQENSKQISFWGQPAHFIDCASK